MATFRVGQRVRIRWSNWWPELAGTEATVISGLRPPNSHPLSRKGDGYRITPDCWGGMEKGYSHVSGITAHFLTDPDQLEPLYDGHQTVSWESMKDLWQPNRETA